MHIRDVHYDYMVQQNLQGHQKEILLHNTDYKPWYASMIYYSFFTFFLMGWLYKILFILNSQKVTFNFEKIILRWLNLFYYIIKLLIEII